MKQDYLWDKTGNDAEIERLEGLLSGFRYMDEAPNGSNVVEFPTRSKRSLKPLIFSMAACLAVGAVAIGIWNLSSITGEPTPLHVVHETEAGPKPELAVPVTPATREEPTLVLSKQAPVMMAKKNKPSLKQKYTAAANKGDSVDKPRLTKEEKYAYGQLMLALSITSSKWQVVQDSINGVEDGRTNDR